VVLGLTDAVRARLVDLLFRRHANRNGVDRDVCEDCVAYAHWQAECQNPCVRDLFAWLFQVAKNRLHDLCSSAHFRSSERLRYAVSLQLDTRYYHEQPPVVDEAARTRARDVLHEHLQALPVRQRKALYLHEWVGATYAEIAERTGTTEDAARNAAKRGRTALRKRLELDSRFDREAWAA
jgi:RNA polymerase sigma factor (sigma-70 family)